MLALRFTTLLIILLHIIGGHARNLLWCHILFGSGVFLLVNGFFGLLIKSGDHVKVTVFSYESFIWINLKKAIVFRIV